MQSRVAKARVGNLRVLFFSFFLFLFCLMFQDTQHTPRSCKSSLVIYFAACFAIGSELVDRDRTRCIYQLTRGLNCPLRPCQSSTLINVHGKLFFMTENARIPSLAQPCAAKPVCREEPDFHSGMFAGPDLIRTCLTYSTCRACILSGVGVC